MSLDGKITLNKFFKKNSFIIVSRINGERFTDWKKKRENEMDGGDDKCLVGVQEEKSCRS